MPREATGELRHLADGFAARITIQGRDRRDFVLPTCATEPEALARCKALASLAARLRQAGHGADVVRLVEMGATRQGGRAWTAFCAAMDEIVGGRARDKATPAMTMGMWAKEWTSGELARRFPDHVETKRSADRDETNLRLYILPHVRDVLVAEFTLADAELVMASIPEVSARTGRPLRPATRRQIAQVMSRLMRLAVYPGKLRTDTPIPRNWLPSADDSIAKECLYPDEEALLLGGRLVRGRHPKGHLSEVPLQRRLAYGFLAREGMRVDEMATLRWSDVDLKRGRVVLDVNKTDDPRDWDLQPDVVAVLAWWKARQGEYATPSSHVFAEDGVPLHALHLADLVREDLKRVGVTRSQLFQTVPGVRQKFRAHDLRAVFVTVHLALGKTETWISDRTGHHSHTMIDRYRRKARTWNLGPLVPFDQALPEMAGSIEDVPTPRALPPIPTRIPHGLPHAARIVEDSQRAQRKPMP